MDDTVAMFVTIMTAMVLTATLIHAWIRSRGRTKASTAGLEAKREIELLSGENSGLKGQVRRLEERIAVLERIATDPAQRTAAAIEDLRHAS
jgi:hypothetical protein